MCLSSVATERRGCSLRGVDAVSVCAGRGRDLGSLYFLLPSMTCQQRKKTPGCGFSLLFFALYKFGGILIATYRVGGHVSIKLMVRKPHVCV